MIEAYQVTSVAAAKMFARQYALAECCYREARGETFRGKLLVCQTIENRVQDQRWPDTYEKVIHQRKQFSSYNPDDPNASRFPNTSMARFDPSDDRAWLESLQAAAMVLNAPEKFTLANHYHTRAVKPGWSDPDRQVEAEGAHVFFEL